MNDPKAERAIRRQSDVRSVEALCNFLRSICINPSAFVNENILDAALRSQGALAKYSNESLGIKAMSLNHQKDLSIEVVGGFDILNDLRTSAIQALTSERARLMRGNRINKAGILARVRELEEERLLLLQDLTILQRAYDLRCQHARQYASQADTATQARCVKEQREIDISFSLLKKFAGRDNVTFLEEARQRGSS